MNEWEVVWGRGISKLPVMYLGLPLFRGQPPVEGCIELFYKVVKGLASWKISLLSYVGCLYLLKHLVKERMFI